MHPFLLWLFNYSTKIALVYCCRCLWFEFICCVSWFFARCVFVSVAIAIAIAIAANAICSHRECHFFFFSVAADAAVVDATFVYENLCMFFFFAEYRFLFKSMNVVWEWRDAIEPTPNCNWWTIKNDIIKRNAQISTIGVATNTIIFRNWICAQVFCFVLWTYILLDNSMKTDFIQTRENCATFHRVFEFHEISIAIYFHQQIECADDFFI